MKETSNREPPCGSVATMIVVPTETDPFCLVDSAYETWTFDTTREEESSDVFVMVDRLLTRANVSRNVESVKKRFK